MSKVSKLEEFSEFLLSFLGVYALFILIPGQTNTREFNDGPHKLRDGSEWYFVKSDLPVTVFRSTAEKNVPSTPGPTTFAKRSVSSHLTAFLWIFDESCMLEIYQHIVVIKRHTAKDSLSQGTSHFYYFSKLITWKENCFRDDPGRTRHALARTLETDQSETPKSWKQSHGRTLRSLLRGMASRGFVIFCLLLCCHLGEFSSDFFLIKILICGGACNSLERIHLMSLKAHSSLRNETYSHQIRQNALSSEILSCIHSLISLPIH